MDTKRIFLLGGAAFEWYTLAIYAALAPIFGDVLSQGNNISQVTTLVFVALAIGFVIRPVGALVLGWFADRFGRKKVLCTVAVLLAILGVLPGFLPNTPSLFMTSLIIFCVIRLAQGFFEGVIMPLTGAYLYENAHQLEEESQSAWVVYASLIGACVAVIFSFVLMHFLSHAEMMSFGWRIPFWASILLLPWAFGMMKHIDESPKFDRQKIKSPFVGAFAQSKWPMFKILIFTVLAAVGGVMIGGQIQYLTTALGLHFQLSLMLVFLQLFAALILSPFIVSMIDRYGALMVSLIGLLGMLLFSTMLFGRVDASNIAEACAAMVVLNLLYLCYLMALPGVMANRFPVDHRVLASGFSYNLGMVIFGATIPLQATYWYEFLSVRGAPAMFLTVAAFVSLIGAFFLTRHKPNH